MSTLTPSGAPAQGKLSVLMTTEGTYPYHGGGVSTWCDLLIRSLPEVDFRLMAVVANPYLRPRYPAPPNLRELIPLPLWGVEEPWEHTGVPLSVVKARRRKTTAASIRTELVPLMEGLTREILQEADPARFGELLVELYHYFQAHDYNTAFRSEAVWSCFAETWCASERRGTDPQVSTVLDVTDCLRLLYRYLSVLTHALPEADVVHSTAAAFCAVPCIVARAGFGVPFQLTEHGIYLREQYLAIGKADYSPATRRFLLGLIRAITRCAYHYADVVSPVCRWNARWETRHGVPEGRIRVIYNGVHPEEFRPLPALPRDPSPTVTTVALIYPLKDILNLLQAAALIRRQMPEVQFRLFGSASDEGYYAECLKLRDELGLQKSFHFMGATSKPAEAYNTGDVVALSSISEGFPFSVVEAMMCGKPVVATDVGGVSEALGDTGVLVRARDPERFSEGLLSLLRDPARRRALGDAARRRALAHFTTGDMIGRHRELYLSLRRADGHLPTG